MLDKNSFATRSNHEHTFANISRCSDRTRVDHSKIVRTTEVTYIGEEILAKKTISFLRSQNDHNKASTPILELLDAIGEGAIEMALMLWTPY